MAAGARHSYDATTAAPGSGRPGMHVGDMGVLSRYVTGGAGAALAMLTVAGSPDRLAAREFRAADIHYKVAQFYALTEHTIGPEVLVMSGRAWQELSDADRAIFR